MDLDLAGRTAVITGASSGLGSFLAGQFAEQGANVILIARRGERLREIAANLTKRHGVQVACETCDITDEPDVAGVMSRLCASHRPDILINNAGAAGESRQFQEIPEASWRHTLDVNTLGAWRVSQMFIALSDRSISDRTIVNIASTYGVRMKAGSLPYMVSKSALVALTQAMALETPSHGVRVNAVCPGFFESEMTSPQGEVKESIQQSVLKTPLGRMVSLHEIAWPVLILASANARAMNGTVLPVDGGQSI